MLTMWTILAAHACAQVFLAIKADSGEVAAIKRIRKAFLLERHKVRGQTRGGNGPGLRAGWSRTQRVWTMAHGKAHAASAQQFGGGLAWHRRRPRSRSARC